MYVSNPTRTLQHTEKVSEILLSFFINIITTCTFGKKSFISQVPYNTTCLPGMMTRHAIDSKNSIYRYNV